MAYSNDEIKNDNRQQQHEVEENGKAKRLVWIDCEMTGLDLETHRLVEIACIITEPDLSVVAEFGPLTIKHPPEVLENMSDWCKATFAKNGLLERIKREGIVEGEVEMKVLEFLRTHTPHGKCPLTWNSVYQDHRFLRRYMPKFCDHLNPSIIVDVTSLKRVIRIWYENSEAWEKLPTKKENHLALDDIRESVAELQYYRKNFFVA